MATFVLVHGAWHGSWCWKRVRRGLRELGHDVLTPTLTGLGERSHLLSKDVSLDTHIQDVVNLLRWEELSEVVLVGHSYGGCVIRGVADRVPERMRSLVYLDAFVLDDGESLMDRAPREQVAGMRALAAEKGSGWQLPPIPGAVFHVNLADRAWMDGQCTWQPLATFEQKIQLTGAGDGVTDVTYIYAAGWEGSPFPASYERAKEKGWRTLEMACGHDVMLDAPGELVGILSGVAGE